MRENNRRGVPDDWFIDPVSLGVPGARISQEDEADIVAATIEHHLAQGVDHIIVTDNASRDGTREILGEYASHAPITVLDDPEHRKQQGAVVTRMARRAATELRADWVINGDADEFVRPVDASRSLAEVFAALDPAIGAFTVPVINLVGPVARRGAGIRRLRWRDERDAASLLAAGIVSHPTPNSIHVGDPEVEVSQGNHFVSTAQHGTPPAELALEVLHLPWRSWEQFERKTVNMGMGYEASPDLRPSPNHHGMRDYRRWRMGTLEEFYLLRNGVEDASFARDGFVLDTSLAESLEALRDRAVRPHLLAACLEGDVPYGADEVTRLREDAIAHHRIDEVVNEDFVRARAEADSFRQRASNFEQEIWALQAERDALTTSVGDLEAKVVVRDGRIIELEATEHTLRAQLDKYESQPVLKALRRGMHAARSIRRR